MQTLVKSINIISIIFISLSIAAACSIELNEHSFITFIQIYAPILAILLIGALGLKISCNPNKVFSGIYATGHAFVNIVKTDCYCNFSTLDRFYIFYDEGIKLYDNYYYI